MRQMPEHQRLLVTEFRKNSTDTEALLWTQLRAKRLSGAKFRRQRPLGRYIADFCCDAAHLVIEIDGGIHNMEDQKAYDEVRDEMLKAWGYKILRVTTADIYNNMSGVLNRIANALQSKSALSESRSR